MAQDKGSHHTFQRKDGRLWCKRCNVLRQECYSDTSNNRLLPSFETAFLGREKILTRRPRIVRGLYLGKEPLEYQKIPTPFRFSFQQRYNDITDQEKDKAKNFQGRIIYSQSMTVTLCSLQTKQVNRGQFKRDRVVWKGDAVRRTNNSGTNQNWWKKELPLSCTKKAKQEADKLSEYQKRTKQSVECSDTRSYQVQEIDSYFSRKTPVEFYLENFIFKQSDYDIWSRSNEKQN
ncbi:hypothetical protein ABFA07_000177 [Porites harrisoni]